MQRKEILPGIEIIGLTLYLNKKNFLNGNFCAQSALKADSGRKGILIFGDLHLGYEEELNKEGFLVPRFQYKEIIAHLEKIFSEIHPKIAIINGDLKHEFGKISEQEWAEVLAFINFLGKKVDTVILVRGNHDTILGPIAGKKNVDILPYYFLRDGGIYMAHGHEIPRDRDFMDSKIRIIGHDHPTIGLRDEFRVEKVKCFLKGRWNNKILIQMPSLNFVTEGTDIMQNMSLSPFMTKNLGNFEAFGVENDRIFYFGKLKNL